MTEIRIDDAAKHYGVVKAVDGLTLSIPSGQFVTLLGPSGSGKTTAMRMIAGLERPTRGIIAIGGRTVSGPGLFVPTHRRGLGMVFQSYAVWPHKTVEENVAFPLEQRSVPRAERGPQVQRMLDLVGLGALGARYPSQLSGGQQQRVSLARALVARPDVLLFDEPLSNLDARLRDSMRGLIQETHRSLGFTAVYVTHDQTEAMTLSDTIHLMSGGCIVQSGTPEALYERPDNAFVADFLGQANLLPIAEVDPHAGTVRLEGGAVLQVQDIPDPSKRLLMVRPHRLRFAEAGPNVVPGTVRSASYLGDRMRYAVACDGGAELIMEVAEERRHGIGDAVGIRVPADGCALV